MKKKQQFFVLSVVSLFAAKKVKDRQRIKKQSDHHPNVLVLL